MDMNNCAFHYEKDVTVDDKVVIKFRYKFDKHRIIILIKTSTMTTSLAIRNAILYFGDNSSMMISVCIIFIALMSILGTTIWREIVRRKRRNSRNSTVHSSEEDGTWNGFNMICIIYALVCVWVLAGEIDNNDGSLMVHGDLLMYQ